MKKIFLILTAIISLASVAHADGNEDNRTDFRNKVLFGVKGGINYSNIYDSKGDEFSAKPKVGFAGGMFVSIPIGIYMGVQPELMFSQKGFKGKGTLLGINYELTRTLNFIDIPIFFSLKPSEFLTFNLGPQLSYLVKSTDEFTKGNVTIEQQNEFKVDEDNYRKSIFGIAGGVDINLKHLVIGGRAAYDLQANAKDGTSSNPRYKNALFQLTVGYRFYKD